MAITLSAGGGCAPIIIGPSVSQPNPASSLTPIVLPAPRLKSDVSLEEALLNRRSVREYSGQALALEDVSQLLWAAQGLTSEQGGRSAPSAGGLYPLEIYLVAGSVDALKSGVYRYLPEGHRVIMVMPGDLRAELAAAAVDQAWIKDAASDIVIAAVYKRTTEKYGDRGIRYVHLEAPATLLRIFVLRPCPLTLGR